MYQRLRLLPIGRKQAARAASVQEQHIVVRPERAVARQPHESREGLAGVARVEHDALQPQHQPDRLVAGFRGDGVAGTTPTERNAFFTLKKDAGLVDVLRNFNPDEQIFTWHSNMYYAKENGKGMRLDHFLVSRELMDKVEDIYVLQDDEFACHSDHLPVVMNINIDL